jgi:protein SCO1/2
MQKTGIRNTVLLLVVVIILVVYGFVWRMDQPVIMSDKELRLNGAVVLDKPRVFSDFTLTDHHGQTFDKARLQGSWSIVFFGFTHCPDICPTTLAILNETYSKLQEDEKDKLQIIMISLDPERDSVDKLAQYIPYFNRDFIGVSGNKHFIRRLTGEINIAYNKVPLSGEDYTIDHSTQLVLINPKGDYHGFFKAPHSEVMLRSTWRSIDAISPF